MIGGVINPSSSRHQAAVFRTADLLFVDSSQGGKFEREFLERLTELELARESILILDVSRDWTMLPWRDIPRLKLDIASFGHRLGIGFVDWTCMGLGTR